MRPKKPYHLFFRLAAPMVAAGLFVLARRSFCLPNALCLSFWQASVLLIFYPTTGDPPLRSAVYTALSAATAFAFALLGRSDGLLFFGCTFAVTYAFARIMSIVRDVNSLLQHSGLWRRVCSGLWLLHLSLVLLTALPIAVFPVWDAFMWAWVGVTVSLAAIQYLRAYTRSPIFLSPRYEREISKAHRASTVPQPVCEAESNSRSGKLFNEVLRILEQSKPWLQEDFSVDDLAQLTHTNRMYLSRSLNFHSGRNFNQLVNYYRILYAKDLIRKDPMLRMTEVSAMCGFRTVVSFNMAFKLNERITPGEYARTQRTLKTNPARK